MLFVCLGNICRSPTAAGVFKYLLALDAPGLQVGVDCAGTGDYHVGDPPDLRSQRAAMRRGVDLGAMRARQITRDDFARFDFILAMDSANLLSLEAMRPQNSGACVQLFLDYAPDASLTEVPDPYYRDAGCFEEVLDLCVAASRGLIAALQAEWTTARS